MKLKAVQYMIGFFVPLFSIMIAGMEERPSKRNQSEEQHYLYLDLACWQVENLHHVGPLSLKYQAALRVYTAFKNMLAAEQTVTQYFEGDPIIPAELTEYLAEFDKIDHDIASLINLTEISNLFTQELCQPLKNRFFSFIDESSERKKCPQLLTELCDDAYPLEQRKAVTACLLVNQPARAPEQRLLLTKMLEIAINKNHNILVKFLAVNGAYLNKKNKRTLRPLLIALRDNNLLAGNILINAYLLRLQNKSHEIKIVKMMNFLGAEIRQFGHTVLGAALVYGNREFTSMILEVALDSGLDLEEFMNWEKSVLWGIEEQEYSAMGEFKDQTTLNSEDQVKAVQTLLDFALEHYVNINTILDLGPDWNGGIHAGSSPAIVNFLRENAARYEIRHAILVDALGAQSILDTLGYKRAGPWIITLIEYAVKNGIVISNLIDLAEETVKHGYFEVIEMLIARGYVFDLERILNQDVPYDLRTNEWISLATSLAQRGSEQYAAFLDFAARHEIKIYNGLLS